MRKIKTGKPLSERESNSLNAYLDEIGKESLLSMEEEQALSEQIQQGDRRALNKLVEANLRFVVAVVKHYQGLGLGMNDLVSEGNVALLQAAEKFKAGRGQRFVAYAEMYIRRAIERALNEQAGIYKLPRGEKDPIGQSNSRPYSVDAPLTTGANVSLLNVLHDDDEPEADQELVAEFDRKALEEAMTVLNDRERVVIAAFYGVGQDHTTFAEIANRLELKRERVRQIRKTALRKLAKHNPALKGL